MSMMGQLMKPKKTEITGLEVDHSDSSRFSLF